MPKSSSTRRFRKASYDVVLAAMLAVSTNMAMARGLEAQQTVSASVVEPRFSGRPATVALFNITTNTLTWLDERGSATRIRDEERMFSILQSGELLVMGSMAHRLSAAGLDREEEVFEEAVRFFGTSSELIGEGRLLLSERLGNLSQYSSDAPMRVGAMGTHAMGGLESGESSRSERAERERQIEREIEAERERILDERRRAVEDLKNTPERIIRDSVREVTDRTSQAVRSKVSEKIDRVLRRLP